MYIGKLDRRATFIPLNPALRLRDSIKIEAHGKSNKKDDTRELMRVERARNATIINNFSERKKITTYYLGLYQSSTQARSQNGRRPYIISFLN
jgi:hypothetical protein